LAKLTEKGLLRPSFVPAAPIRALRDYTRLRVDLTRERSRYWQRLEKLLEDALIKVSCVASTLDTLSVRDMLDGLIAGERDPRRLADPARGRMRTKRTALVEALRGRFDDHDAELVQMLLDQIDALNGQIATLTARIEAMLDTMTTPAAAVAARTDTFLGARYRRLVKRRGKLKALVAVARSILVVVWRLLADPSARFHTRRLHTERQLRNHLAQLAALGYRVTVEAAA